MKFIEINNKNYEIKFTINVLIRMEEDGIDVMHMENLMNNMNFALIRKLFYYGLINSAGKSLTLNKAGDMMDEYLQENSYRDLMTVLLSELAKSLGYDKLGKLISEGILNKTLTVPKVETTNTTTTTTSNGVYRVVVGSYKDKNNAISIQNKLKKDGSDSFLIFEKQ